MISVRTLKKRKIKERIISIFLIIICIKICIRKFYFIVLTWSNFHANFVIDLLFILQFNFRRINGNNQWNR